MKRALSLVLSLILMFTFGLAVAAEEPDGFDVSLESTSSSEAISEESLPPEIPEDEVEESTLEALAPPPVDSDLQIGDVAPDIEYVNNPATEVEVVGAVTTETNFVEASGNNLSFNPRLRGMFQFTTTFSQAGTLNASNPNDMFFFSVTTPRKVLFKGTSSNASLVAGLYQVDWSTGNLSMIGYADANLLCTIDFNAAWLNAYGADYAVVYLTFRPIGQALEAAVGEQCFGQPVECVLLRFTAVVVAVWLWLGHV